MTIFMPAALIMILKTSQTSLPSDIPGRCIRIVTVRRKCDGFEKDVLFVFVFVS